MILATPSIMPSFTGLSTTLSKSWYSNPDTDTAGKKERWMELAGSRCWQYVGTKSEDSPSHVAESSVLRSSQRQSTWQGTTSGIEEEVTVPLESVKEDGSKLEVKGELRPAMPRPFILRWEAVIAVLLVLVLVLSKEPGEDLFMRGLAVKEASMSPFRGVERLLSPLLRVIEWDGELIECGPWCSYSADVGVLAGRGGTGNGRDRCRGLLASAMACW
jgi:hypothetical protein